jgi:hypothetical protein
MSLSKFSGLLLGSAALVAGHGYVSGAVVDGTYYGGYLVDQYAYQDNTPDVIGWSETETDLGFIDGTGYSDPNIICHKDAKPGAIEASVKAGGSVELQWTEWPESHHGPVITYLANCNGECTNVDKTTLEFFKIDEGGLINDDSVPGTWASDDLISNNNSRTITVPSGIASGNYVLRHEIIALHSAGNTNGAQNYPQCINLKVTGGGSDSPSGVKGTALYKNTDPGISVNIYQSLSTYEIPGPALYTGAASGSGASATSAPASVVASSTAAPTAASIESASSSVSVAPVRSPSPIPSSSSSTSHRSSFTRRPTPPHSSTPLPSPSSSPPAPSVSAQPQVVTSTVVIGGATSTIVETSYTWATEQVTVTNTPVLQTKTPQPNEPSIATITSTTGSEPTETSSSSTDSSSYDASSWNSYLSTLSADQLLSLVRSTMKWLVTDQKHARDLSK